MGIDAHILIRGVSRSIVTDEWLKEKSWAICEAIGAKSFFISDGLRSEEFKKASDAWHAAFNAHPLHAEYEAARSSERKAGLFSSDEKSRALADRIRADVGQYKLEELRTAIQRVGERYREEGDPAPGTHYSDDGPVEIVAEPDECLLQLSIWGRYYGPGYERGDILKYCAMAEWLEQNIQGCEVWYGGDSSDVEIKRFDSAYREELRKHLYTQEGRDYFKHDSWVGEKKCIPAPCGLCPGGKYRGSQFGSGSNGMYAAFGCAGCGKNVKTNDGGVSWTEHKDA